MDFSSCMVQLVVRCLGECQALRGVCLSACCAISKTTVIRRAYELKVRGRNAGQIFISLAELPEKVFEHFPTDNFHLRAFEEDHLFTICRVQLP